MMAIAVSMPAACLAALALPHPARFAGGIVHLAHGALLEEVP
jgi:hypothetical protein